MCAWTRGGCLSLSPSISDLIPPPFPPPTTLLYVSSESSRPSGSRTGTRGRPREFAESLTRTTRPGVVSPQAGGGEQARQYQPRRSLSLSPKSRSGDSLRGRSLAVRIRRGIAREPKNNDYQDWRQMKKLKSTKIEYLPVVQE